ncbi:uncharacterized protein ASPGLDRAFT_42197 [Aspergillus glaucus CBS 516.65]|uniref:Uncharacterized protein n=1 Tax=Aspergillus glaucus CBS 516.65 TaxID=1160497 RepID=A0A1L9VXG7_ASPGL|nr:hypothetical protein ASPGLDRAFT_42197 [Aspergillus glaucus CBS 516.65]OJJ88614.1 hypothetical protein ASPGLDRAFT_42197 [Aspergillus glaucus CBS 516.65]
MTRVCSAIAIPPGGQGEDFSLLLRLETDYAAEGDRRIVGKAQSRSVRCGAQISYHAPGLFDEGNSGMNLVASYR